MQWFSKFSVVRTFSSVVVKDEDSWDPISREVDWGRASNLHVTSYQVTLKQSSKTTL